MGGLRKTMAKGQAAALAEQEALQKDLEKYKTVQQENQRYVGQRAQLTAQISENQMVEKELKLLEEDATVFKLVGPVLIPQDLIEAKANVAKRVECMSAEVAKIDGKMKENETACANTQKRVMEFQERMAKLQQQADKAGA